MSKLPIIEMVPLSKIEDNLWRDKKLNPISKERVDALASSITRTGEFWVGVYGRKLPNGKVQLAFGHHRLDAAKIVAVSGLKEAAQVAGLKSIPVTLREFTDGEMLTWMVSENLQGEFPVALEAVSAAVKALAQGSIEIEAIAPRTTPTVIRYAPSFVPNKPTGPSEGPVAYTADTLAKALGGIYVKAKGEKDRAQNSVVAALSTLELLERKVPGYTLEKVRHMPLLKIIKMNSDLKSKYEAVQKSRAQTAEEKNKAREASLEAQRKFDEAERERKLAEKARKKAEHEAREAATKAEAKRLRKLASIERDKEDAAKARKENAKKERAETSAEVVAKEEELKRLAEEKFIYVETDVDKRVSTLERIAGDHDKELDTALSKTSTLKDKERLWKAWQDAGERCKDRMVLYVDMSVSGEKVLEAMRKKEEAKRCAEKESE